MIHKKDITSTYACLDCRKVFKKHKFIQDKRGNWTDVVFEAKCPQCSELMYETGSAFKAPKSSNNRKWSNLKPLFLNGYRFFPDRGNPFEDVSSAKVKSKKFPPSEFRKPARKRNK